MAKMPALTRGTSVFVSLALLAVVWSLPLGVQARTILVSKIGSSSDGQSWETAYRSIGAALTASASGDDIWVAAGTYYEAIVMATGVDAYGGFIGEETWEEFHLRDPKGNVTTIDASLEGTHAVVGANNCALDGFTITGGEAESGAGVYCRDIQMVLRRVTITDNKSLYSGGGMFCSYSNIFISDSRIHSNTATHYGGGIAIWGGHEFQVHVVNSTITENACGSAGGGIACWGRTILERCILSGNVSMPIVAPPGTGVSPEGWGGAIYARGRASEDADTSPLLRAEDCLISKENRAVVGGGLSLFATDPSPSPVVELTHSTFDDNITFDWESADLHVWEKVAVRNSIIHDSFRGQLVPTYCNLIQDNTGEGNIVNQDPQWVDPENGDYRLKLSSPCIDSGSTTGPATDLDGNPRPVNVLGIGRDGPGAYDMGCYEFQLPQADLNSDGQVNAHDLFLFEDQWHSQ